MVYVKLLKNLNLKKIDNLISLAIFGSYGTKYFREGFSDIDIFVLIEKREDIIDEIEMEDNILHILQEYFNYDNIHLTFLTMRDYDTRLANQYIDSEDKLILDEFKEIDFRLYVNKYLRENEWRIKRAREYNKFLEEN